MAFEKYSDDKLKKLRSNFIIVAIVMLVAMCFVLGLALYQISNDIDSNLVFLVPTVFGPLTFLPIIFSSIVDGELKKRSKK